MDITSDSKVNGNFTYRWSPASLTLKFYFTYFICLYLIRRTINKNTLHLKPSKNQTRGAALRRPAIKLLGAPSSLRSTNLALSSALVHQTKQLQRKHHTTKPEQTNQKHTIVLHWFLRLIFVRFTRKIPSS